MSETRGRLGKATPAPFLGLAGPVAPAPTPVPEPEVAVGDASERGNGPEKKKKVGGWNGYESNLERIRAAQWHTEKLPEGWPSMSEMTEGVLLAEAERLEGLYNDGKPFEPMPANTKMKRSRRSGR